jgi:hypothetical protein
MNTDEYKIKLLDSLNHLHGHRYKTGLTHYNTGPIFNYTDVYGNNPRKDIRLYSANSSSAFWQRPRRVIGMLSFRYSVREPANLTHLSLKMMTSKYIAVYIMKSNLNTLFTDGLC